MVRDVPTIRRKKRKIERILKRAGLIVGYNLKALDLPFMAAKGINTTVKAKICNAERRQAMNRRQKKKAFKKTFRF